MIVTATPLDDERRDLAARYWPLALRLAASWARAIPSLREEFFSLAGETVTIAARDWDDAKTPSFATFLHKRIRFAFLVLLTREKRERERVPIDPGAIADEIGRDDAALGEIEVADHADHLARRMPGNRASLFRSLVSGELGRAPGNAVAAREGISRQRASQLLIEIRDRVGGRAGLGEALAS